ncbi:MAG: cytochrome c oxidase subunit 3 [Gammaproteobacteria bacterium]
MSMWTLLIALLCAIVVWFFIVRRLTSRPWIAAGAPGYTSDIGPVEQPAKKVALYLFLGSISSLFALFITAYIMRMDPHHGGDWHTIAKPGILWVNSVLLILSSVTLHWAKSAATINNTRALKTGLILTGIFTVAFLLGQLLAWQQLHSSTYFQMSNPALGFFYLLTGVHALHLLGGLYVWARITGRYLLGAKASSIASGVGLCTVYWHYLLLVWLIMFVLLLTT